MGSKSRTFPERSYNELLNRNDYMLKDVLCCVHLMHTCISIHMCIYIYVYVCGSCQYPGPFDMFG